MIKLSNKPKRQIYTDLELYLYFDLLTCFYGRVPTVKEINSLSLEREYFSPNAGTLTKRIGVSLKKESPKFSEDEIKKEIIRIYRETGKIPSIKVFLKESNIISHHHLIKNFSFGKLKKKCRLKKHSTIMPDKKLKKEFLKFKNLREVREISPYLMRHYSAKNKKTKKWLRSHFSPLGSIKKRGLYAIEFEDKSVYVGLTFDYDMRLSNHKTSKKIGSKMKRMKYKFVRFNRFYDIDVVGEKEEKKINSYKRKGYLILNRASAGGLGGGIIKWTKRDIFRVAKGFKYRTPFKENYPGCWAAAIRLGCLKEATSHMRYNTTGKPHGHWVKNPSLIFEEATLYERKSDFIKLSPGAYAASKRLNLIGEIEKLVWR